MKFKINIILHLTARCIFSLDCQFELSGADGIVRSSQVEQEGKTKPGQAVDCIWTIKATPNAKVGFIHIIQHIIGFQVISNR